MPFPPLVAEGPALSEAERARTARQRRLLPIGDGGQRRLAAARVAVVGAGGIGSPVILYLAAAGVGTLGVVDDDLVDDSNLQRQVIFTRDDLGARKIDVATGRARSLSPGIRIVRHDERLTSRNAERLLDGYHLVIDGSDSFETRYAVADACDALGVPLVWGSVLRFDAQLSVFWSRPPSGPSVRLRDVFPSPPPPDSVPSCAEAGVLGSLCGQVGSALASEAVKLICGIGVPLVGRMLVVDALSARTREIPLTPTSGRGDGGTPSFEEDPSPVPRVAPEELATLDGPVLLDVREPEEHEAGTIPHAYSVPLGALRADPSVAPWTSGPLIVFCQRGPRAREAARTLRSHRPGADVWVLSGGYEAWRRQTS